MSAFVSAYADEETCRALRAEYAGCTCGRCGRAKSVDIPWPEDAEKLDEYAVGITPSDILECCFVWCDYVGGLVTKSRPVYTDEDGECPMYEED